MKRPPSPLEVFGGMEKHLGDLGKPAPLSTGRDPFSVLVSTIISLRTRDAVTEQVSVRLLGIAPDPEAMLGISESELESVLRPAGFYRRKAVQIKSISSKILERFNGQVPRRIEDLLSLPGVGRKTACYMLGMVFDVPAVCVDVHVHRISNRTGLVKTRSPDETEKALMKAFPEEYWNKINHLFVRFGQRVCRPRYPLCSTCPFCSWCPSSAERQ